MIRIEQLHIGYKKTLVQTHDLELLNGVVYILIGKNGSGKSTFLKTLSGQIPSLKGTVFLDSTNLKYAKTAELPYLISVVNSKFTEVDYLTVFNYIALGRSPYTNLFGQLKENDVAIIQNALTDCGIQHLADRFTSQLSDGEKQLVAIAKALAQQTPNIILDEPTAYLDYLNKVQTLEILKKIALRENKCIILSSHDIDIAIDSACPFLLIENPRGELVMDQDSPSRDKILKRAF